LDSRKPRSLVGKADGVLNFLALVLSLAEQIEKSGLVQTGKTGAESQYFPQYAESLVETRLSGRLQMNSQILVAEARFGNKCARLFVCSRFHGIDRSVSRHGIRSGLPAVNFAKLAQCPLSPGAVI